MDERIVRAREVAPTLVGLRIEDARRVIAAEPRLYLREFSPTSLITQSLGFGRITVVVDSGRVTKSSAG